MANRKITELPVGVTATTGTKFEAVQGGINVQLDASQLPGLTREFNRTFSETLLFDKNEIFYAPYELDDDITYTLSGSGNLSDQASGARQRIITDGTHAIFFGSGFDYIYGITNGQILEAGNYEIYFLFTNGSVTVNVPGTSQQDSEIVQLLTPSDFAVVSDGENALDFSWSDVANESGYQIEKSDDGVSGWVLYSTPASGSTSGTETGLDPGTTRYYRIKALGDGVSYSDSPYTVASGTTEDVGDVTAPVPTFNPANGTSIWPINKPFTITFNEAIQRDDGSAVTNGNVSALITLKQTNSGGANIGFSATIDVSKTIITVNPTTTLGTNQLVYVAIDGVEDASGNEISLTSITFTTTEFTYFDGISNRLIFGDILDTVLTTNDTNFWLEITLNNANMSGARDLITKASGINTTSCFKLYYAASTVVFGYFMGSLDRFRFIVWENTDLTTGEHTLVLKYDGSIDTNDGLDRCTLLIDGVIQSGGFSSNPVGSLSGALTNSAANFAFGNVINSAGSPMETRWYEGEAKDMIVRSNAGATTQLNIPVLYSGNDTSVNNLDGTWVE